MFNRILCGVAAAALFVSAGAASAQDFSADRISSHIKTLSSDAFEGRFPGKVGEALTLAYLQYQYEQMGLEPGGPDGQWLQPVDLMRYTPSGAPTASFSNGGESHALEAGAQINLRAGAGAPSSTVHIANAPVVFAGYGIVAPERNWDDYGDMDLTGKVVIIMGGQPESFGEDPNYYGSGTHKTNEALERGAIGVITLNENTERFARMARFGGRPRMTIAGAHEPQFTGSINVETAQALMPGQDVAALVASAKTHAVQAMDTGSTLSADINETTETIHSHNLLAKITGTERPDEYVIYSAHWDHIGKAAEPNEDGDDIYNGAWDNASGTSGVMEMARAFKTGPAPERTVVFLHVTAEEQGLLGSEWYGEHPVYPLARTAADINIDMLPFTPATHNIAIFGIGKSGLEDDLARLAQAQGDRVLTGDGYPEEGFYYRSDHFNFAVAGVPALMPWTGIDFAEGGVAVGKPYYEAQMAAHYHDLSDEWDPNWDYTAALQNLDLLYKLGLDVADSEDWPQWKPDAEFAATRAETASARGGH